MPFMPNNLLSETASQLPVQPNEILVAIRHLDMVTGKLRTFGIEAVELDRDGGLNLVLLTLKPLDDDAKRDDAAYRELVDQPATSAAANTTIYNTGAVVTRLRNELAAQYQGWIPIIGRNRLMGNVEGANGRVIIKFDDQTLPEAVSDQPALRPADGAGSGVRVAIADTPLSPQPWMSGGWKADYADRLPTSSAPNWRSGHGTFVTGLILNQAPGAIVEAHAVLNDRGSATAWDVSKRIVKIGRSGVDILNLSFACYTADGEPPLAIATAIEALDYEVVVVAAAGNHGLTPPIKAANGTDVQVNARPAWPAALPSVIAVGAADDAGRRTGFSPDAPWVDVITTGEHVLSTYLSGPVDVDDGDRVYNGFARWRGSSFAAALISGAIAAGTQPGRISARQSWENIEVQLAYNSGSSSSFAAGANFLRPPRPLLAIG